MNAVLKTSKSQASLKVAGVVSESDRQDVCLKASTLPQNNLFCDVASDNEAGFPYINPSAGMNQLQELLRLLIGSIKCQEELCKDKNINLNVAQTLSTCFHYSIAINNQNMDSMKVLEIDSVLDFLQDELNTGHWSDVPVHIQQCFSSASFIKCLIILKSSEIYSTDVLKKCLKCLDMGLILGAPLEKNDELLTQSARHVSQEIKNLLNDTHGSESTLRTFAKRKIDENHRPQFETLNGKELIALDCPSVEYFKKYFIAQTPVKLKGCMDYWPATRKWLDINYLLNVAGERTVPVEIGPNYADENWTQKLMTLKDFITNHYLSESGNVGYLAQYNLFAQVEELKEDICVPDYCCLSLDYDNTSEPESNAWFGPAGTVSPLHYDLRNNILAQVYGTKQVILFSPQDSAYLYAHEDKLLSNTGQVNPVEPDLVKYPEFAKSTMYKCLLEPGEMLFIPSKWWHHVTALDKSFSVNFWWQ